MPKGGGQGAQIWTGSISFGLVNVPIVLVPAVRDHDFRFREIHEPDMAPVVRRRFCSAEDAEVPREEIGRGYELDDGTMITLTEEELESVMPERSQTVEIERFVEMSGIDPLLFDRSYFALPAGKADGDRRAYRLLAGAMESGGRAAIGRFVLRTREYLVAIRVRGGALILTTLRFASEVRSQEGIPSGSGEVPERLVSEAVAVIEELTTEWEPESYEDCYRKRLSEVIHEKAKGRDIEPPQRIEEVAARPTAAPDLMSALKRTLEEARSGRGRAKSGGGEPRSQLATLSRDQLYKRAREVGLPGRSKMSKEELRDALARPK